MIEQGMFNNGGLVYFDRGNMAFSLRYGGGAVVIFTIGVTVFRVGWDTRKPPFHVDVRYV